MGLNHSPNLVTNGLIGFWDAANIKSYPGSGTSLYDAAKISLTGTITNSPAFTSEYKGGFTFDGTNKSIVISHANTFADTTIVWARSNTATWNTPGWISCARTQNGHIIHPTSGTKEVAFYYMNQSGTAYLLGAGNKTLDDITIPHMYTFSTNGSSDHRGYFDNALVESEVYTSFTRTLTPSPTDWTLGLDTFGGRYGNGVIYCAIKYNRQLTDAEVAQNFYALRSRFRV